MTTPITHSVLLADDSGNDRFLLGLTLRRAGQRFKVVGEVESGEDLIVYLTGKHPYTDREKHPIPDILILDWRMPDGNGAEVLKWLQKNPVPGMKVVVWADPEALSENVMALGATYFIPKSSGWEMTDFVKRLEEQCFRK